MDKLNKKEQVDKVIELLKKACYEVIDSGEDTKIPQGENPIVLVDTVCYTMVAMAKAGVLPKITQSSKNEVTNDFAKDTDPENLKKQTWH